MLPLSLLYELHCVSCDVPSNRAQNLWKIKSINWAKIVKPCLEALIKSFTRASQIGIVSLERRCWVVESRNSKTVFIFFLPRDINMPLQPFPIVTTVVIGKQAACLVERAPPFNSDRTRDEQVCPNNCNQTFTEAI